MNQQIDVRGMGPHEYAVTVTEGNDTTHHRVLVEEDLLDDLGIIDADELQIVHESVAFLLEHETGDGLGDTISLDQVSDEYEDYIPELQTRLAP